MFIQRLSWLHGLCHYSPFLYKHIHKVHHEYKSTFSLAGEYAHPLEMIFVNSVIKKSFIIINFIFFIIFIIIIIIKIIINFLFYFIINKIQYDYFF